MIGADARGAWLEIEARLRPYVARRVAPADIDDVLQDIFVRLHKGMTSLRDGQSFGGFAYRIAENAIFDMGRARARSKLIPVGDLPEQAQAARDEGEMLESELGECVALFVARLPSPYREAVTLTELEGLTQKDAAEMLGISLSGMKSRVQRGREKIRDMFEECCHISVDGRGRVVECEPRSLDAVPADCRDAAVSWATRKA
jgi:RNA polymerase sigma-70 factor (ECF subfamily)